MTSQMTIIKMDMATTPTMAPVVGAVPTTSEANPAGQKRATLRALAPTSKSFETGKRDMSSVHFLNTNKSQEEGNLFWAKLYYTTEGFCRDERSLLVLLNPWIIPDDILCNRDMESAPMYLLSDEMATASITSSCALQVDDSMTSTIAIAAKHTVFILLLLFHGPASKKQKKEKKIDTMNQLIRIPETMSDHCK